MVNVLQLAFIQVLMNWHGEMATYTEYNCILWVLAVLFKKESWWAVIFTNTLALTTTFYTTGCVIDRTFFKRMREVHGMSMSKFIVGDACLHLLPSLWLIWTLFYRSERWTHILYNHGRVYKYAGLYSCGLNLLYGMLNGFSADHIYVPLSTRKWWLVWMSSIGYHMMFQGLLEIPKQVMFVPLP